MLDVYESLLGGGSSDLSSVLGLINVLLALAAAVLVVMFVVPKDGKEKPGFMGNVQKIFCFKGVFLDKLLTVLFAYGLVSCVLGGLFDIINGMTVYPCLEKIFIYPLVLRLILEAAKLLMIGVKNLTEINAKLKSQTEAPAESLEFECAPQAPKASVGGAFCPHCGNKIEAGSAFCPHCGKSTQ